MCFFCHTYTFLIWKASNFILQLPLLLGYFIHSAIWDKFTPIPSYSGVRNVIHRWIIEHISLSPSVLQKYGFMRFWPSKPLKNCRNFNLYPWFIIFLLLIPKKKMHFQIIVEKHILTKTYVTTSYIYNAFPLHFFWKEKCIFRLK